MNSLVVDDKQLAVNAGCSHSDHPIPRERAKACVRLMPRWSMCARMPSTWRSLMLKCRKMTGLELAKRIKDVRPNVNIIFVTAYEEYAFEAHKLYASGYLLGP